MSATEALVRSWKVGRYTAHLSVPKMVPGGVASAVIEWSPGIPRDLSERDLEKYRAGRRQALAEIAEELGITVGVIEA